MNAISMKLNQDEKDARRVIIRNGKTIFTSTTSFDDRYAIRAVTWTNSGGVMTRTEKITTTNSTVLSSITNTYRS